MHLKIELNLNLKGKTVWIVTCLSLLQVGFGSILGLSETSPAGFPFFPFLSLMLLMSFPAALLPVLTVDSYMPGDISPLAQYCTLWFCMFVIGYLQWFVLVPRMRRPGLTSLGLSNACTTSTRISQKRRRRRRRRAKLDNQPIPPRFCTKGLSPLQRAISGK